MIKNIKFSKRFLSMLAGLVIGVTPVAGNVSNAKADGFTLVKQEMKIEGNDLNLDSYIKKLEETYYYLKQFIDYDELQADLQCLYYVINTTYMTEEIRTELSGYDVIYADENVRNNLSKSFRLLDKINEYNEKIIRSDYENGTMDINHLIDPSALCFDEHDRELVYNIHNDYFTAYQNGMFNNESYISAFKRLTTLNAEEKDGNAFELTTGSMNLTQRTTGRETIEMLHDWMKKNYTIEELSEYYVKEELLNGNWELRDDVQLDLNCLKNDLELAIFQEGQLITFCYDLVDNNITRLLTVGDLELKEASQENMENSESNVSVNFVGNIEKAKEYLTKYISYDHLQVDLQCLYFLTNKSHISAEDEQELISNGIVYETNFETQEGLQNFMQAYSLIGVILDYNQSVIRKDYKEGTMDINHLIDPSVLCADKADMEALHNMHVNYFNAYANGRFDNEYYHELLKELTSEGASESAMWNARNIIGGDVMQMQRDDMQERFDRKELDKFFIGKELNKGQWIVREDVTLNSNSKDELEREVYDFNEVLWPYVYTNVNNDLFAMFQVQCNTK